jgi:hypothetical protein
MKPSSLRPGGGCSWPALRPCRGSPARDPAACRRRRGVGALEVEAPDGRRFLVGSGLTNALRRDPPPVGSSVTYRYRDLTSSGLPRFAIFVRRHEAL